jgi:hypothetical protein
VFFRSPASGVYYFGVNYAKHGHAVTPEDWTAMMDFFDTHSRSKKIDLIFEPQRGQIKTSTSKTRLRRGKYRAHKDLGYIPDQGGIVSKTVTKRIGDGQYPLPHRDFGGYMQPAGMKPQYD